MKHYAIEKIVEVPENTTATLTSIRGGKTIQIKGPKGELVRTFKRLRVHIFLIDKKFIIQSFFGNKAEASMVGTIAGHLNNMIKGVTEGFTYKLKIVFSHFPISVKTEDNRVVIENFTGERSSRLARILGDVKVSIKSDDVIVQGTNLEEVSQTAANIEQATKVKKKDPRVFLDGIYVYKRLKGMET